MTLLVEPTGMNHLASMIIVECTIMTQPLNHYPYFASIRPLALQDSKCLYGITVCDLLQDVGEALKQLCPDGLDIVYEGVGGDLRKTILPFLKPDGCMLCVGYISQYPHTSQHRSDSANGGSHETSSSQQDDGSLLAAMPPDHMLMWQAKTVEHGKQRVYGSVWPKVSSRAQACWCNSAGLQSSQTRPHDGVITKPGNVK